MLNVSCLVGDGFFGAGFRAYYTIKDGVIVFLLCGGSKSTQSRDIKKAQAIVNLLG